MRAGWRSLAAIAGRPLKAAVRRSAPLAALTLAAALWAPAPALAQDPHLIVIVGVGGDEEHTTKFNKWAGAVVDEAKKRGVLEANITYLGERTDLDPARMKGRATRDAVVKALADTAAKAKPDDEVFILLIGHGSFDGSTAAFNLSGPDLTAEQYGPLLAKFQARVVFVNTASSSGAFVAPLAGPGRTIIAATRTGGERNETRFAEFFVEALSGDAADRDRNGRISVQEAFDFAKAKVTEAYEQAGNLLSEHATMDDGAEGKLASTQFLAPQRSRTAEMAGADPELRALVEQRDALERRVAEHKMRKDTMDQAQYEEQLESLLTELALKTRAIRELEAKK